MGQEEWESLGLSQVLAPRPAAPKQYHHPEAAASIAHGNGDDYSQNIASDHHITASARYVALSVIMYMIWMVKSCYFYWYHMYHIISMLTYYILCMILIHCNFHPYTMHAIAFWGVDTGHTTHLTSTTHHQAETRGRCGTRVGWRLGLCAVPCTTGSAAISNKQCRGGDVATDRRCFGPAPSSRSRQKGRRLGRRPWLRLGRRLTATSTPDTAFA
jgi:hypothetical protein